MKNFDHNYHAKTQQDWRNWLKENHNKEKNIWLVIYKKDSDISSVYYPEAVDEALCFGWVDSHIRKRDDKSYYQYFAARNPKSNWSRVNKEKVARLIKANKMTKAGMELIDIAKANGCWDALNDVENGVIPDDLQLALSSVPNATTYFKAFPRSAKRAILEWILNAKKPETRLARIEKTARLAGENIRANQ